MNSSLNYEAIGDPIASIVPLKTTKRVRNSKYKTVNNPKQCEYCFKTLYSNKARHQRICPVKKAGAGPKNCKLIFLNSDDKAQPKKPMNEIECDEINTMQIIPNKNKERTVYYVTGQAASGKSYWTNKLIEQYHNMYPKRPIYVFSLLESDPSLTGKYIKRIKLDEKFVSTGLSLADFKNSLVVYDDVDTIRNKKLRDKLDHIMDSLLNCGRHEGVSVVFISHLPCNGKETKNILSECNVITFFPKTQGARSLRYLLSEYFGLSKKSVQKIKKLNTRAVSILRTYPMIVMYDNGCYILDDDDD